MEKANIFDTVMDYIDEHVKSDYSEIQRGVYAISQYTDMDFCKFLSILSGGKATLNKYFMNRKLYFASQELVELPHKPIVDIALDYGYSEQSSFTRAIKNQFGYTPNEIRKQGIRCPNDKLSFANFNPNANEYGKRLKDAISGAIGDSCMSDDAYFETFISATDEYGFDTATCCAISEVSERIGVPFGVLLNACFETMIDVRSSDDYLDPKAEKAIECGITSEEEMERICEYYDCEYYQLNGLMVTEYRKHN